MPKTAPRKAPSQERARITVEAILGATAHILIADGFDRLTTNRVASRAGVSIGSVYQYFPSKEALVAALVDRHLDTMFALMASELANASRLPFEQATLRIVRSLVRAHMVEPDLHRAITEQVPRVGRLSRIREIDRQFEVLLHAALEARSHEVHVTDTRFCAFLMVHVGKAVTIAALHEHPEFLEERLETELTKLFVRYVAKAPPSEARASAKGARVPASSAKKRT